MDNEQKVTIQVDTDRIMNSNFEMGPIRPPSEGGSHSLLLRTTRNCPWNRCKFCYGIIYGRGKFSRRSVKEIKEDIDSVKNIADELKSVSLQLGLEGEVTRDVGNVIASVLPGIQANQSFMMVFTWLLFGGKTAFLQDANSLNMPFKHMLEVLQYIKKQLPSLERITSYARSKTIYRKKTEELQALHKAGLTRLHVGLETGDDELLKYVNKGVTAEQQIIAGKMAKDAGFEVSDYVMIGLGGRDMSDQHALNTARVINEIKPDYIRLRPFAIGPDLPLFEDYEKGIFKLTSPHERLRELKLFLENLDVDSRLCFDHFLNSWYRDSSRRVNLFNHDFEGYKLPEQKEELLGLIEEGLEIDEEVHLHARDLIGVKNL